MSHDDQDPDAGHIGEVRPRTPQKPSLAGVFIAYIAIKNIVKLRK